jgi:hypothetical protein
MNHARVGAVQADAEHHQADAGEVGAGCFGS